MSRDLFARWTRARWRYQQARRLLARSVRRDASSFGELRTAFYERFWRDAATNVGAEFEPLGYGFWRIRKNGRSALVNENGPALDHHLMVEVMENKPLVLNLLASNGCPVPKFLEYDIDSLDLAWQFLQKLPRAAVIKPAIGTGGGQGVTMKIRNRKQLVGASCYAATFDWSLLMEEEVSGHSYRLTFLDGKLIDAVRRDPPMVTGDGRRTIRQLMRAETEARLRGAPGFRALSPLVLDSECQGQLQAQGLTPEHVPAAGRQIVVKTVINQNSRLENHRVLPEVHSCWKELGSSLLSTLGIRFAGLDVLTGRIDLPYQESGGVINEINCPPGIHHHVLVAESESNPPMGEMILEAMLSSHVAVESGKHP